MKVVLLTDVKKLGKRFDIVEVADGHAANALFPKKLAEPATGDALRRAKEFHDQIKIGKAIKEDLIEKNLKAIESVTIHIDAKANEKGHLFQSIHERDLAARLKSECHADITPDAIKLASPLKEVGTYTVDVWWHGKKGSFKVIIDAAAHK